jgi:hypothetical protein
MQYPYSLRRLSLPADVYPKKGLTRKTHGRVYVKELTEELVNTTLQLTDANQEVFNNYLSFINTKGFTVERRKRRIKKENSFQ